MVTDPPHQAPGTFSGATDSGGADASFRAAFDVAWLVTDLLAAAAKALEPADLAIQLGEAVPKGAEEMMFGVMSRLPHPDAARVLAMIGQHHPDRKVAKAARRAAYRVSESIP